MLSFWQLWLKERFRKRDLEILQGKIRGSAEELGIVGEPGFEKNIPVLQVPIPDALEISLHFALDESPSFLLKRNFLEFLFGQPRLYVVDPYPGAMFGKPVMLAAFYGYGFRPRFLATGDSYPVVNKSFVPMLMPELAMPMAIQGLGAYQNIWGAVIPGGRPPPGGFIGGPLTGGFPAGDRPNPGPNSGLPTTTPPAPVPNGGTTNSRAFFYGLCFQHPDWDDHGARRTTKDPLLGITQQMTRAFLSRCYRSAIGAAGIMGVPNNTTANNFEEMMQGLQTDIAAINPAFGSQSNDQMVIFVAAHGWGADSNKTGDVAMVYAPGRAHAFIRYADFFTRLAAIPEISAHKDKVTLIIFSCRAGRVWEGGVVPGALAGMQIITSTDTGGYLCRPGELDRWLYGGVTGGGGVTNLPNTWTEMIDLLKWFGRNSVIPTGTARPARNGTISGCRVQIALKEIRYTGINIGNNWRFDFSVNGNTNYQNYNGNTIPVTPKGPDISETVNPFNQGTTHTLNPVRPIYDRLWGPCATNNRVDLNINVVSEQTAGAHAGGSASHNFNFICNNGVNVPDQTLTFTPMMTAQPHLATVMSGIFTVSTSCT